MTYVNSTRIVCYGIRCHWLRTLVGVTPNGAVDGSRQLALILKTLKKQGYVEWKRVPAAWLRENLDGQTLRSIEDEMLVHAEAGLKIDRVPETRDEYRDRYEFHFDFLLTINERRIYIETTLDEFIPPVLTIVSMHYDYK